LHDLSESFMLSLKLIVLLYLLLSGPCHCCSLSLLGRDNWGHSCCCRLRTFGHAILVSALVAGQVESSNHDALRAVQGRGSIHTFCRLFILTHKVANSRIRKSVVPGQHGVDRNFGLASLLRTRHHLSQRLFRRFNCLIEGGN
jgi:hypothetical protein